MSLSRVKTWTTSDVPSVAEINAEFNNVALKFGYISSGDMAIDSPEDQYLIKSPSDGDLYTLILAAIAAGKTLLLTAGTYDCTSGTDTCDIPDGTTVVGMGNVIITRQSGRTDASMINIGAGSEEGKYVTFKNITINPDAATLANDISLIKITGSDGANILFEDVKFHIDDTTAYAVTCVKLDEVVENRTIRFNRCYFDGSIDSIGYGIVCNQIFNLVVEHCCFIGFHHQIVGESTLSVGDCRCRMMVRDNLFYMSDDGVSATEYCIVDANNGVIENNVFVNASDLASDAVAFVSLNCYLGWVSVIGNTLYPNASGYPIYGIENFQYGAIIKHNRESRLSVGGFVSGMIANAITPIDVTNNYARSASNLFVSATGLARTVAIFEKNGLSYCLQPLLLVPDNELNATKSVLVYLTHKGTTNYLGLGLRGARAVTIGADPYSCFIKLSGMTTDISS